MYDTAHLRWSTEILDAVGLPHSIVPDVGGSSEVLGTRDGRSGGRSLDSQVGTPVVGGGADNACGAAGVGAVVPGEAVTSWGTSGTVLAPDCRPARRSRTSRSHVLPRRAGHVVSHGRRAVGGRRVRVVSRSTRARPRRARGEANERLNAEAATIPPRRRGRDVPSVSPGRAHAASRRVDARRAARTESRALARASHARGDRRRVLRAARFRVDSRRSSDCRRAQCCSPAAARESAFVRRLQAEIFGVPVCTVNREEGPAYGAALLAAVGVGAFPDLAAAAKATLTRGAARASRPGRPRGVRNALSAVPRVLWCGASGCTFVS